MSRQVELLLPKRSIQQRTRSINNPIRNYGVIFLDKQTAIEWFSNTRDLVRLKSLRSVYQELIDQTQYLANDASAPQRLWHVIEGTDMTPGCKTCKAPVSWDRRAKQYKTYCGNPRCPNVDPDIIVKKQAAIDKEASLIKRQRTNLQRYGVENYLTTTQAKQLAASAREVARQDPAVIEQHSTRLRERIKTKYGVDNFSHTLLSADANMKLNDANWLHQQHYVLKRTLSDIATELNIQSGPTIVGRYLKKHGMETQTLPAVSTAEKHIAEWLAGLGEVVDTSNRDIIRPLELDIVLPDHKLAIEYCGVYWHSEQRGKSRQYHKQKMELCEQAGYRLITLFSDEWEYSSEIVKTKIASIIGRDARPTTYARTCSIRDVSMLDRISFLNMHHIQGDCGSSITIGLYHEDELVAVSGWVNLGDDQWLLARYATSNRVVGGFSKLVKAFERRVRPKQLVSFADLRWSVGNTYTSTGWVVDKILPPDYQYSQDGHTRVHKFNFRRANLSKLLASFDPMKSEWENCRDNNVLRIWDCGKLRLVKVCNP